MHTIGIDFGTTKTLVSRIKSRTGEAETVRLGQGTDHIPTSVFIKDNGDMLFGDEADDRLTEADGVYLRGFKMSLGNSTPVYAQMNDEGELVQYMAAELVTRYLSYIRTRVQETVFSGEPITRAIITRPVEFSPARCEELREAAIAAGFTEVELTTEPEAAGLAFCSLNDARAFRHSALIVDWGGGTLDFALVTREEKHIITHPNLTAGDITMGGERFDHLLWSYAENQLRKHAIFNVNPVAMLPIVRKNKERLSASDTATLRLSHEHGTCPPIELTQQLFNRLINDSVERAAGKIMQLLERIPEADKPEMLLLVGGSCRIPYIKRKLEEVCKLPAVSWHLSREAVSLGAALWDSTAIPVPPTSSARKRTFGKVMTLGALLATATSAPFIYTHFSQEAAQTEDEAAQHIAAAEAKAKAAEEARLKAEEEAKAKAEEEARQKALAQAKRETKKITVAHSELDSVLSSLAKSIYSTDDLKTIEAKINEIKTIRDEVKMSIADIGKKAPNAPEHTELNNLLTSMGSKLTEADEILNKQKQQLTAKEQQFRNIPKSEYDSKLLIAAKNNDVILLKLLLDAGANKDMTDLVGRTPLYLAADNGNSECVKLLLDAGANKDMAAGDGRTPLFEAAHNGHSECVKLLLDAGANKDMADENGWTPLSEAAGGGPSECVKLLLDAGADKDKADVFGCTPLTYAADNGNSECVKLLLDAGANKDMADKDGWTPLSCAAAKGHSECVKLLLDAGADKDKAGKDGWTPLHRAAYAGHNECVKLLLEAGADKDKATKDGWTPLSWAAFKGQSECVKLLLDAGADKDKADKDGRAPLFWAASCSRSECVKLLLDAGADKDKADKDGWTPLHFAASEGRSECVKLLLDAGADKDMADKDGWTPLHRAAFRGHNECVKILIDKGAKVNKKTKKMNTPLELAKQKNHTECIRLLEAAGAK